jgi:hypothetical protein
MVLLCAATAACTALVGLQDVPNPSDGGPPSDDGPPPPDGGPPSDGAPQDGRSQEGAPPEEAAADSGDAATRDAFDAPPDAPADSPGEAGPCDPSHAFGAPVLVQELTSQGTSWDYSAHLSPDELTVYFASTRPGGVGEADLYVATRASKTDPFGAPVLMPNVNTPQSDEFPSVSADGLTLVLSSDRANAGYEHIYVATRSASSSPFGAPVLVSSVTSSAVDREGYLLPDVSEMYFASNRPGGAGNDDIYRSLVSGGNFAAPASVSELNTASAEEHPTVTGDDLTIFFSSTRPDLGALGSWDILVATRASTSAPFGSITNLAAVNSPYGDLPDWISPDGCRLYMSSSRGPGGSFHIYVATRQ